MTLRDALAEALHTAGVNPDHLDLVTGKENLARSPLTPGSRVMCPAGHPYRGDNLDVVHDGTDLARRCRTCKNQRARVARWRARFRRDMADPAFRAALTEAVEGALEPFDVIDYATDPHGWTMTSHLAAGKIVDRLLRDMP